MLRLGDEQVARVLPHLFKLLFCDVFVCRVCEPSIHTTHQKLQNPFTKLPRTSSALRANSAPCSLASADASSSGVIRQSAAKGISPVSTRRSSCGLAASVRLYCLCCWGKDICMWLMERLSSLGSCKRVCTDQAELITKPKTHPQRRRLLPVAFPLVHQHSTARKESVQLLLQLPGQHLPEQGPVWHALLVVGRRRRGWFACDFVMNGLVGC